jgi:hypothetical protein
VKLDGSNSNPENPVTSIQAGMAIMLGDISLSNDVGTNIVVQASNQQIQVAGNVGFGKYIGVWTTFLLT